MLPTKEDWKINKLAVSFRENPTGSLPAIALSEDAYLNMWKIIVIEFYFWL